MKPFSVCAVAAAIAVMLFFPGAPVLHAGDAAAPGKPAQAAPAAVAEPYPGWKHRGELAILTTPAGANLPAAAVVEGFPLLVRLHKDWFDFSQARPGGEDIRFSDNQGVPLPYQIDEWDAARGTAGIWVRIPRIQGHARQAIRMYWGQPDAAGESNPRAVFNQSNGYLGVWHMGDVPRDDAGGLDSRNVGTTPTAGVIGTARHFDGRQGVFCGDAIMNYPAGSAPHSTEAWICPERPNTTVIGWGNEQAQGKVVMQYRSPPHVSMDCYFSDANVAGRGRIPLNQWTHVVHTYQKGEARVYVNGALDGISTARGAPLSIRRPARLWLGGWYDHYDFAGSMDEVRVSNVARSADWVRLEYENQQPLQTLVGLLAQPGSEFSVSPERLTVAEGETATFRARAGGAEKVSWTLLRAGRETPLAVDRFAYTFHAGRVRGDTSLTLRFKAVYADSVKTRDIPITIREDIPEPVFTLEAPAAWDGRRPIEVVPRLANLREMQAKGAGAVKIEWDVAPIAVVKQTMPDRLLLKRAMAGGLMHVTATAGNGGEPTTHTATIAVSEPERDAWLPAVPAKHEKPEDGQFYARDDSNQGTLFYNGTLEAAADSVFLRLFAGDRLIRTETAVPAADRSYAFAVKLKPGLVKYGVELGARRDGRETVLGTAGNLLCGDALLVNGQSNAVATDWGPEPPPAFRSPWIRTFGSMSGNPQGERGWGEATYRGPDGKLQIGYWAMELARRLVDGQRVPVCILNGAVGGTRIDQHQRNPANPEDLTTIYGRLLWRVRQARLAHGIRAVFWHQGENDQGADGPDGGFGWQTYRRYFLDLAAAWQEDFPNLRHYYVFQIWPKACAMGIDGSDNRLREVQRTLPTAFSHLSLMSTLGVEPAGGCHYPPAGYADIARLICPLVERDLYGRRFSRSITPPNLVGARFASAAKDAVALAFDQPVQWDDALAGQFYLDGRRGEVASGQAAGKVLTLKLKNLAAASTITYLDSAQWSQKTLLRGENGIAALTFCEVPIQAH
jgi:hypothetical protein